MQQIIITAFSGLDQWSGSIPNIKANDIFWLSIKLSEFFNCSPIWLHLNLLLTMSQIYTLLVSKVYRIIALDKGLACLYLRDKIAEPFTLGTWLELKWLRKVDESDHEVFIDSDIILTFQLGTNVIWSVFLCIIGNPETMIQMRRQRWKFHFSLHQDRRLKAVLILNFWSNSQIFHFNKTFFAIMLFAQFIFVQILIIFNLFSSSHRSMEI